ncbi:RNA polymerase sigma factor [Anaeromassilibacillus senegalensis]|uniref:RNA polymerase sigma factor n=1 Tax=Anaeromassilibacillus senegalensis TaxID=1673717 RepID=UPI0006830076|nr:sigma-70 family RNA polymerase sigma factor [Anaeromassilibacillus senegalensis]
MWLLITGPSDDNNPYRDNIRNAYFKYRKVALHAAFEVLHNQDDAEEVMQETFTRIIQCSEKPFHDGWTEDSLRGFIYRVAQHLALDRAKHKSVARETFLDDSSTIESKDGELARVELSEAGEIGVKALQLLSHEAQTIVGLYIYRELTVSEIATVLNKSVWAVDKALSRALKRMKKYMDSHHIDLDDYVGR